MNFSKMKKAVFLDRDGVINSTDGNAPFTVDKFFIMDGVPEAIKKLNNANYLVIVVTNQPDIAKGFMTFKDLEEMHEKLKRALDAAGAHVDAIYVCPHHPEKGFDGEVPELKIKCDCRKPKPGLLLQAMKEHGIDPKQSWMVGDSKTDIAAGQAAGVRTIRVTCSEGAKSKEELALGEVYPDLTVFDLKEAVEKIIR
jgi:D-glycero-D-manno-heptose 1,7-bisphosphate phosphatase